MLLRNTKDHLYSPEGLPWQSTSGYSWNHRNLVCQHSGGCMSEMEASAGLVRPLALTCRRPPPPHAFAWAPSVCVCVLTSSSNRVTVTGLELTLTTSFRLAFSWRVCLQTQAQSEVPMNWERGMNTSQPVRATSTRRQQARSRFSPTELLEGADLWNQTADFRPPEWWKNKSLLLTQPSLY